MTGQNAAVRIDFETLKQLASELAAPPD